MARAKALTTEHLEMIDGLAAFFVESDRNAELLHMTLKLMAIGNIPGASAVFAKKRTELLKAKRNAAK